MRRTLLTAALAVFLGGCASGPLLDNPFRLRNNPAVPTDGPIYVPQGPMAYARVFEAIYDILLEYWDIYYANRYDGRIETVPRIAPGIEQLWKPGSPDPYERLLAFFQTIRHRCVVTITTARDGGYFIDVKVYKELEDLATPVRSTVGEATFRLTPGVERQYDVIDPTVYDFAWIPAGRDLALEQVILERIARLELNRCEP